MSNSPDLRLACTCGGSGTEECPAGRVSPTAALIVSAGTRTGDPTRSSSISLPQPSRQDRHAGWVSD